MVYKALASLVTLGSYSKSACRVALWLAFWLLQVLEIWVKTLSG
jgi:hypothetical protein